jgi:hypothetical protein
MLTLFGASTFDGLTEVVKANMYGCATISYDDFPHECVNSQGNPAIAAFFFSTYCTISAMVLLSIFLGVVTISMEQAAEDYEKKMNVADYLLDLKFDYPDSIHRIKQLEIAFGELDKDNEGTLSFQELHFAVKCAGFTGSDLQQLVWETLQEMDDNHDGVVDLGEFVQFMVEDVQELHNKQATKPNHNHKRSHLSERRLNQLTEDEQEHQNNSDDGGQEMTEGTKEDTNEQDTKEAEENLDSVAAETTKKQNRLRPQAEYYLRGGQMIKKKTKGDDEGSRFAGGKRGSTQSTTKS